MQDCCNLMTMCGEGLVLSSIQVCMTLVKYAGMHDACQVCRYADILDMYTSMQIYLICILDKTSTSKQSSKDTRIVIKSNPFAFFEMGASMWYVYTCLAIMYHSITWHSITWQSGLHRTVLVYAVPVDAC